MIGQRPKTLDPRLNKRSKVPASPAGGFSLGSLLRRQVGLGYGLSGAAGFTMIEILIVAMIFATVSAASLSIFSMGMQIWRRAQGPSVLERKALFAMEKIGKDIRASYRTKVETLKGKGDSSSIQIPSLIVVKGEKLDMIQYGRVHYEWNSSKQELCRAEETATNISQEKTPPCRVIASKIRRFKLRYFIYEGIGESYSWYDEWEEKADPPLAVQVAIEVDTSIKKLKSSRSFAKTIFMPTGGKLEDDEKK